MSMFEMSDDQIIEWREKYNALAAPHVNGETVIAAAPFRRGGAAATMATSTAGLGGIVYAAVSLFNKKKAGGLPQRVMLSVTPERLYAFDVSLKGTKYKIKGEAAVWERAGLKLSTERKSGMTALTIESPAEGEKATLVGVGVKDDPLSQELIAALQGSAPGE